MRFLVRICDYKPKLIGQRATKFLQQESRRRHILQENALVLPNEPSREITLLMGSHVILVPRRNSFKEKKALLRPTRLVFRRGMRYRLVQ